MRALRMRGGAVWQLVGLITRRSQVQILPPLPIKKRRPLWAAFSFNSNACLVPKRLTEVTNFAKSVAYRLHIC